MVRLIAGLGNPGREYAKTRHNVGFWCVERLLARCGDPPVRRRFSGLLAEISVEGRAVMVLRPLTYMNLSGGAVREAVRHLNLARPEEELLVIHDDLDLPAGRIRLRQQGSAGGHNGVKSIIAQLGDERFLRVRIGVGRPPVGVTAVDHVLKRFGRAELPLVAAAVERAAEAAERACSTPFPVVMNAFNS